MKSSSSFSSSGARRRAARRRDSAGAAMFIVAVTLGLLAAMGVYGLSATASDIRAAGQERQAAQSQRAAELAIIETAQSVGPATASPIVAAISNASAPRQCRSTTTGRCLVLGTPEMKVLSSATWATAAPGAKEPFTTDSFGDVKLQPYVRVELTDPISWPASSSASSAGYQIGLSTNNPVFTEVRATVYVEMRSNAFDAPPDAVVTGRGRLVLGPYIPYKL